MKILFPGSKAVSTAVILIIAGGFCFSTYRTSKQAQLNKYKKQQLVYEMRLENNNQNEIAGIETIN